jgi:DNA topoisomerase-2
LSELQKELDKFTNQARFVQMIIDGKLIISKKKKPTLIAELKEKGFKAFPKVADAVKAGETEPAMEDEEASQDAEVDIASNAYDYLLGVSLLLVLKTSMHGHS